MSFRKFVVGKFTLENLAGGGGLPDSGGRGVGVGGFVLQGLQRVVGDGFAVQRHEVELLE